MNACAGVLQVEPNLGIFSPLLTHLMLTWGPSMDAVLSEQSIKVPRPSLPQRKASDLSESLHGVWLVNAHTETKDCEIFLRVVSGSDCHVTTGPRSHSAFSPLSGISSVTPCCSKKFYFLKLVRAEFLCL